MSSGNVISFGPYTLKPQERLLLKCGDTVNLGSRSLDVLIALLESAGEVVGQSELIARAWPNMVVCDGSLRVTVAALRKVLGDGEDGVRYIANVTGRGYCFIAPLDRVATQPRISAPPIFSEFSPVPKHELPPPLKRMVGRKTTVEALSEFLVLRRFVSVVGPGGMGKTTVAVSVAHVLLEEFSNGVFFVDLGAVTDASVVANAVATAVGSSVQVHDPIPGLMAFLTGRRVLLILDNCEHVIDVAASLAERLYNDAPEVHILTTSREALRAKGEYVHLLTALDYPTVHEDLTAAEALATPAVQLFMDRAFASGHSGSLNDADAPTVASICSRLDGIALAIELAASRVGTCGLQGTADLLNNRFKLLWQGRRSAPPRQKTLAAMLDWSFNLLSVRDRRVLSRLSVFVSVFTLEAAQVVAADDQIGATEVAEALWGLIDKSLVWVVPVDGITHHRLLDPTLAFAAEKLAQHNEVNAITSRHALYFANRLSSCAGDGAAITIEDVAFAAPYLGNIRSALQWSFSPAGDATIGVQLAAAAAPLFFDLSLFSECVCWCEQGLAALPKADESSAHHLTLLAFLAASAMFTRGNSNEVGRSIEDALNLAEARGDQVYQMHLLVGLSIFFTRIGDFQGALRVAQRGILVAEALGSPGAIAAAESVLGVAYHLVGDQMATRRHCERSLEIAEAASAAEVAFFGYDHEARALIALARCYWLIGLPDRSAKTARQVIDLATKRDDPVSLCMTLIFATTVFLWRGDLDEGEQLLGRLLTHSKRHSLGPYHTLGLALSGELAVARGNASEGVALLQRSLGLLHVQKLHVLTPALHVALADGLVTMGEFVEAAAVIDAGLTQSVASGGILNVPELLRIRGEILLQATQGDLAAAERAFLLSMQKAKEQSALGLELRSAMSIAGHWSRQGKAVDAGNLLREVYGRFSEGHKTKDMKLASQLLADFTTSIP